MEAETYKKFWLENLKGIDHVLTKSYYTRVIILKFMLIRMGVVWVHLVKNTSK